MITIMLIQATAAMCAKESSKMCCCYNLSWQEVILYSIFIGAFLYFIKMCKDIYFQNSTIKTQKEYDLEDQKRRLDLTDERWNQKKELTKQLLEHLNTNKELNNKYVEVLEKLIGIANENNSK